MQDEEKAIIRTLTVFMIFALVGSSLILVSSLFDKNGMFSPTSLAGLVGVITCLGILFLLRTGHFTLPRVILPATTYLIGTYLIFTGEAVSVRDDAVLLFSLVVAMAGLLLGKRGVVVFGILSILTVGGSVYAEISGWIVNHIDASTTTYDTLLTASVIYGLTFSMMYILVNILTNNLARVRSSQDEVAQTNLELQNIRASLEAQVQERTAVADAARIEAESARLTAETQMWLASGQAQLAEQLRGDLNVSLLANNIIRHICRYTGAQTGVLFLADGDGLGLTGSYAYTGRPGAKTRLRFGEGLIGQAARDNVQMVLTEIPADAPLIASSLGESLPRQVLIAALEINGEVIGVLELASLGEFTTLHQVFISRSAESIAIAVRTTQARERIAALLAESQRQTEELQAQEEELRAANEELRAQSENLKVKLR